MKRIGLISMAFLIMASQGISQIIINVPADQPSIQAGIDYATDGDTVLVADSAYYENINFKGKAITVASHFILDNDTSHISGTVIDGSQSAKTDSTSVVTMMSGEDTTSILTGFTITGGGGTSLELLGWDVNDYFGGGIVIDKSGGTILHNIIEGNHTIDTSDIYEIGGGIGGTVSESHTLIIRNNVIRNNTVEGANSYGGGIGLIGGKIIIEGNRITNNKLISTSSDGGGGIFWAYYGLTGVIDEVIIRNNFIDSNEGQSAMDISGGGGIYTGLTFGAGLEVYNNVISNNVCGSFGGGIYNWANPMLLTNNTIINNASGRGGNSYYSSRGSAKFINNILWSAVDNSEEDFLYDKSNYDNNKRIYLYHNLLKNPDELGDEVTRSGNIFEEPVFNEGFYEPAQGHRIIGRGTDSIEISWIWRYAPSSDYFGNTRPNPVDEYIDIGAIESPFAAISIGINEKRPEVLSIAPNPVYDLLTIGTTLSGQHLILLTNLNGQLIISKELEGTTHQLDLSSFNKGIYFITIRSKDFVTTRKIIKL